jgi:hypothetical protein
VPAGTDVVFRNQGKTVHNAVAVDGSWSTADAYGADVMPAGASTTVTVDESGVYRYCCTLHGTREGRGMYATLVVGERRLHRRPRHRAAAGRRRGIRCHAAGARAARHHPGCGGRGTPATSC